MKCFIIENTHDKKQRLLILLRDEMITSFRLCNNFISYSKQKNINIRANERMWETYGTQERDEKVISATFMVREFSWKVTSDKKRVL